MICYDCGKQFHSREDINYADYCLSCAEIRREIDSFEALVGKKITKIMYNRETDQYYIYIEPNFLLTAEDSEYGDNAFKLEVVR